MYFDVCKSLETSEVKVGLEVLNLTNNSMECSLIVLHNEADIDARMMVMYLCNQTMQLSTQSLLKCGHGTA